MIQRGAPPHGFSRAGPPSHAVTQIAWRPGLLQDLSVLRSTALNYETIAPQGFRLPFPGDIRTSHDTLFCKSSVIRSIRVLYPLRRKALLSVTQLAGGRDLPADLFVLRRLRWCFPPQNLPWVMVHPVFHRLDLPFADFRKVRPLRKPPPNHPVMYLVGPLLPGGV